jgi:hypothetical protein
MNNMDETTTNEGGDAQDNAANHEQSEDNTATAPLRVGRSTATTTTTTLPSILKTKIVTTSQLPSLTGKYQFIKALCESQRPTLGKKMADHSIAMFKTHREIQGRLETLKRFNTTYIDKDDTDEDGQGKLKPFISISLRSKQPLNHSKKISKDSRCQEAVSEMNKILGRAHLVHEKYKAEMAKLAFELAEMEINARKNILCNQYCEASIDIAEGLFYVGKALNRNLPLPSLTSNQAAFAAIHETFKTQSRKHWIGLWFIDSAISEEIELFYSTYQRTANYNYDRDIKPKIKEVDLPIIEYLSTRLRGYLPHLTTDLWDQIETEDTEKKCDAELANLYGEKQVDRANEALSDRMDADDTRGAIVEIIREEIRNEEKGRISKNKNKMRKNYLGDPKHQGLKPTSNGNKKERGSNQNPLSEKYKSSKKSSNTTNEKEYYPQKN